MLSMRLYHIAAVRCLCVAFACRSSGPRAVADVSVVPLVKSCLLCSICCHHASCSTPVLMQKTCLQGLGLLYFSGVESSMQKTCLQGLGLLYFLVVESSKQKTCLQHVPGVARRLTTLGSA